MPTSAGATADAAAAAIPIPTLEFPCFGERHRSCPCDFGFCSVTSFPHASARRPRVADRFHARWLMLQTALFPELDAAPATRTIRVALGARAGSPSQGEQIGEQKDIRYFAAAARSVLNGPETTGMGYWSVNP